MKQAVLLVLAFTFLFSVQWTTISCAQQADQAAPEFTLSDRSGRSYSLHDFRNSVVLLDFWASWCGPCRMTMPHVQQWHEKFQSKGLKVIGVNIEGPNERALTYVEKGNFSFMILFDQGNWSSQITRLYGVRGIPHTVLVDRKGKVRFRGHPLQLPEEFILAVLNEK